MKKLSFLLILGTLLLASCEYKIIEFEPIVDSVDFVSELEPIFDERCALADCHTVINPVLVSGSVYSSLVEGNYFNLENPESSVIYIKSGDAHGVYRFTTTEQEKLLNWIRQGANAEVVLSSFAADIEPMFQAKCITCHTSISPVLTTGNAYGSLTNGGYIDTANPTQSSLYLQITTGHGGLTPSEIANILKWIKEGAIDN